MARRPERSPRAGRGQRGCTEDTVRWDWTKGPQTRLQRIKRSLVG